MLVHVRDGFGFIQIPGTDYLSIAGQDDVDVDVSKLSTRDKVKLCQELQYGRLVAAQDKKTAEEVNSLNSFYKELQEEAAKAVPTPVVSPKEEEARSKFNDDLEDLRVSARRLLKKTMPVIKKEVRRMKPREVEILLGEERNWKNRKLLVPFLETTLNELKNAVPANLAGLNRADKEELRKSFDAMAIKRDVMQRAGPHAGLISPVTDEVEEDEEEIIIKCDG